MSVINQKDYLKKYLKIGKGSGEKKKKKKVEKTFSKGLKVIDDDIDTSLSREIQDDLDAANEDAPQIVAIIDERPPSLRIDDQTKNNLWQPIGASSNTIAFQNFKIPGIKLNINKEQTLDKRKDKYGKYSQSVHVNKNNYSPPRTKDYSPGFSPSRKNRDDQFPPRTRDQSPGIKSDDYSPPRKGRNNDQSSLTIGNYSSPPSRRKQDQSPQRKQDDYSPPRRGKQDQSPQRRQDDYPPPRRGKQDQSPQRRQDDYSPPRRGKQDQSPQRRQDDYSPPRRGEQDQSPQRKQDDYSPPRRGKQDQSPQRKQDNYSPTRKRRNSDQSPPRKGKTSVPSPPRRRRDRSSSRKWNDSSPTRRKGKPIDESPPRRKLNDDNSPPKKEKISDQSPPRQRRNQSPHRKTKDDQSPRRKNKKSRWEERDVSPSASQKPEITMSGKKSGLQTAKNLTEDIIRLQKEEEEIFKTMSADVSGVNAATIVRKKKKEDDVPDLEKEKREKELKEKYCEWGKGVKQVQDEHEKMAEQFKEMNKPLARYANDEDLEKYLKEQERDGDPMLAYIRKKKKKVAVERGVPEKPTYMGDFMPNRFGIRPGYRWDGVDRSNGYEKKWFQVQNSKKAMQEEALLWSQEDM